MAEIHSIRSQLSHVDLGIMANTVSEVTGSLGLLAMMAKRVDDNEMVVDPRDLSDMMETLRSQLVGVSQKLQPYI